MDIVNLVTILTEVDKIRLYEALRRDVEGMEFCPISKKPYFMPLEPAEVGDFLHEISVAFQDCDFNISMVAKAVLDHFQANHQDYKGAVMAALRALPKMAPPPWRRGEIAYRVVEAMTSLSRQYRADREDNDK